MSFDVNFYFLLDLEKKNIITSKKWRKQNSQLWQTDVLKSEANIQTDACYYKWVSQALHCIVKLDKELAEK